MAGTRRAISQLAMNSKSASSPAPRVFVGFLLLGFFIIGFMLHIQTSESFFLGAVPASMVPNWTILTQPWQLLQGQIPPRMAAAVIWGWGIELTFLICVVGYEIASDAVSASSRKLAGWFQSGTIGLILFNGYADYLYASTLSSPWGAIAFAAIVNFSVLFFGTIGWHLLVSGLSEWNRG